MEWVAPIATLVLCVVLPYVVNLAKQTQWSANTKRWLAIAFSVLGGIATAVLSGVPTPETIVSWALAVIGGTQIAYAAFKSIGITSGWLDSLEGIGNKPEKKS